MQHKYSLSLWGPREARRTQVNAFGYLPHSWPVGVAVRASGCVWVPFRPEGGPGVSCAAKPPFSRPHQ